MKKHVLGLALVLALAAGTAAYAVNYSMVSVTTGGRRK